MRREYMSIGELDVDTVTGAGAKGLIQLPYTTGPRWFVDSNNGVDATGRAGKTADTPFASIDYAIGRCTADEASQIVCMEGHEDNISAAGDITCDVADVELIGLGNGSRCAKLIWDTATTADIDVSAANVTFNGFWMHNNFADVAEGFDVAATGDYFTIKNCRVTDGAANLEMVTLVALAAAANNFTFLNNIVQGYPISGQASLVKTAGECIDMVVANNSIIMCATESIFDLNATALTGNPLFRNNLMFNLIAVADYCVEIDASTPGIFVNERYGCNGAAEPVNDPAASFLINCQGVDAPDTYSILFPKTATAWP